MRTWRMEKTAGRGKQQGEDTAAKIRWQRYSDTDTVAQKQRQRYSSSEKSIAAVPDDRRAAMRGVRVL